MSAATPETKFAQRHDEDDSIVARTPKPRRGCLRACGWGCGLPVLIIIALGLLWRLPGLLLGGTSVALELEQALAGAESLTIVDCGYRGAEIVSLPNGLDLDELRRRVRTVPGWDHLAVIAPYGSGGELASDPQISWTPSAISVASTLGWPQDEIYHVLVIRHGFLIGRFDIETNCYMYTSVISRR